MDCGDKKFSGEDGSDLFSTSAWAQALVLNKSDPSSPLNFLSPQSIRIDFADRVDKLIDPADAKVDASSISMQGP